MLQTWSKWNKESGALTVPRRSSFPDLAGTPGYSSPAVRFRMIHKAISLITSYKWKKYKVSWYREKYIGAIKEVSLDLGNSSCKWSKHFANIERNPSKFCSMVVPIVEASPTEHVQRGTELEWFLWNQWQFQARQIMGFLIPKPFLEVTHP